MKSKDRPKHEPKKQKIKIVEVKDGYTKEYVDLLLRINYALAKRIQELSSL